MQQSFLINLSNNRFSFFLNRVVYFSSFDEEIAGDQHSVRYSPSPGRTNITVRKCIFEHIQAGVQGAAISIEFNTDITIQSTIFDDIKADTKEGQYIFSAKLALNTKMFYIQIIIVFKIVKQTTDHQYMEQQLKSKYIFLVLQIA